MKQGKDFWIMEILWHIAMVLGGFTAGANLMPGPKQDVAVGIYIAAATVCLAGLHLFHLYTEWRYGS
jgi:H+/gluconate symporter-like permease